MKDDGTKDKDPDPNGLTSIHTPIHCCATRDGVEPENDHDRIIVDNFLDKLAEIALSVAARKAAKKESDEGN